MAEHPDSCGWTEARDRPGVYVCVGWCEIKDDSQTPELAAATHARRNPPRKFSAPRCPWWWWAVLAVSVGLLTAAVVLTWVTL